MATRRNDQQLDLFGNSAPASQPPSTPRRGVPIGAAAVAPALREFSRRLPSQIYLGTSSWSFPGWAGLVYDREVSKERLARDGLAAYAQHPLLRAVGIDRSYYAPLAEDVFAGYAAAVPATFRFLVKAHELCTLAHFPNHARYGAQRGKRNALFLNSSYAAAEVIGPITAGLGDKAGPILFQFPPQDIEALGGPDGFADRLNAFFRVLPRGPLYAVEIRNARLFTPGYLAALADAGACHCISAHPTMPDVATQLRLADQPTAAASVMRWMLAPHLEYEHARERYQPFNQLIDEDPGTREALAWQCARAVAARRPAYVIINNKAEGSAPLSVFRLAERIAAHQG